MKNPIYLVCGSKSWNRKIFDDRIATLPGEWFFFEKKDDLTAAALARLKPARIFFLHWSWKVPEEITTAYECINFHMTDVPYGRGGSPLQNLILRGHTATKLSALRMTAEMDGGPVYLKEELTLEGTAQEILERSSEVAAGMIEQIIHEDPQPSPQSDDVVLFERRTPAQSEIPENLSPEALYDFIRMLDGEGYPPAFIERDGKRFLLTKASLKDGKLTATATVVPESDPL